MTIPARSGMVTPMAKKSETIEIRVSHALKSQLAKACQARGSAMSDMVRTSIERELTGETSY